MSHAPRETKFLISQAEALEVSAWARRTLVADPNGAGPSGDQYVTTTLTFDTAEFDVFHRRGSFGRAKFRVRRYGRSDVVFLERKLRTDGLLAKRRAAIPIGELSRFSTSPAVGWPGHWFHERLVTRGLQPACQVSYLRLARQGWRDDTLMRLTLDHDLRVRPSRRVALEAPGGIAVLPDQVILELKYIGELPVPFQQLVDRLGLVSQTVSKYRLGAAALGHVAQPSSAATGPHGSLLNSSTGEAR